MGEKEEREGGGCWNRQEGGRLRFKRREKILRSPEGGKKGGGG